MSTADTTPVELTAKPVGAALWSPDHIRVLAGRRHESAPLIGDADVVRIAPDLDIWDAWPVQDADGTPSALPGGQTLWMALGAPRFPDPDARHGHARIHLILRDAMGWRSLGPAMPDKFAPGSREWSGSALLAPDRRTLTLFFTATGRRGEAVTTFEQRLFRADATLTQEGGYRLTDWRDLSEFVIRDSAHYMASDAGSGAVGTIKAFRDPAYFRDPRDGRHHVFFAASLAGSISAFNGAIGWASARDSSLAEWDIQSPLVSADTLNNELERPHAIFHQGLYYLFWSTQRHVFNPDGPTGPTGLYGMVSDRIDGGWRPLNGTGLVFANPDAAPKQAYSWLVLPDLQVTSFIDAWGSDGSDASARRFGATFAPMLRLRLQGDRAGLEADG
ncbi:MULTISPECIES: glycoside hydrolase family 68 protein [unclassified Sphingomonas]|uniref:glycoside hydrolase family 68 protein n=1 Tax=unclassified Sphingomonas TaxID=196159 RepID=UPI0021517EE6|nr:MULTISPECIES: glycoside hydrolase family 68 protein [unclassified Sphingomonas]MCR5872522.1 glycoside hydrolase family 68 protein [Sphingomonas sp. J344]UUX99192.1 glycoside hydrolase family 68 protein [Sphingomonas sp. J315]